MRSGLAEVLYDIELKHAKDAINTSLRHYKRRQNI